MVTMPNTYDRTFIKKYVWCARFAENSGIENSGTPRAYIGFLLSTWT